MKRKTKLVTLILCIVSIFGCAIFAYADEDEAVDLSSVAQVTLSQESYKYTGKVQQPTESIQYNGEKLVKDTDYTVVYPNSVNAGTYSADIKYIGKYKGSTNVKYYINKASNKDVKILFSRTYFTYTGKVQRPNVTVKYNNMTLANKRDYTVSYPKSKKIGHYYVTIKFKGNYSGTSKVIYYINPKGTSIKEVDATLQGFKVTWKKQSTQTSGYQVQYSTNSNFKNSKIVTVNNNKAVSKNFNKMGNKKTYYVRVRTYKVVNKKAYYPGWSKTVKVKTKGINNPSNIKVTGEFYGFKTSWTKAKSVDGYQIQYADNKAYKNHKNVWVKNGSSVSKSVAGLKGDKTYYVSVRSYKGYTTGKGKHKKTTWYYGNWYNYVVTTRVLTAPGATTLKSVSTPNYQKLKLNWTAVSGVSGYEIEYQMVVSNRSNEWNYNELVETSNDVHNKNMKPNTSITGFACVYVSGGNNSSYTVSNLPRECSYLVRVRAYNQYNGKKAFGPWSEVKTAKTTGDNTGLLNRQQKDWYLQQVTDCFKKTSTVNCKVEEMTYEELSKFIQETNGIGISKISQALSERLTTKNMQDGTKRIYNYKKSVTSYNYVGTGKRTYVKCCFRDYNGFTEFYYVTDLY